MGRSSRRPRMLLVGIVAMLALAVVGAFAAPASFAGWGSSERATGQLAAGTVRQVADFRCSPGWLLNRYIEFDWHLPDAGIARSGYRWTFKLGGITLEEGTISDPNATSVRIPGSLLGIVIGAKFSLVAVTEGGWESVPVTATVTMTSALGIVVVELCSVP